jgi:putative Ca2+/H+ antiporter (TMEM165/GDT1 family)
MNIISILLISLAVFLECTSGDKFDSLDRNFDGMLDRSEFSVLSHELHEILEPFIISETPGVAKKSGDFKMTSFISNDLSGSFMSATINSLVMIIACELGDKTFFIAAVLAMRNGRLIVYLGAMGALAVMHVLSCFMGYALPALLPKVYTHYASALLFVYFGLKLLKDGQEMGDGPSEELQEVEEELIEKKDAGRQSLQITDDQVDEEAGTSDGNGKEMYGMKTDQFHVLIQAFTLTFLAEWGDRSQIATIALASSKNPYGVIIGGLIGHALCTALAVLGGRMLAARISERTVALVGGVLFLVFAVHSFYTGVDQ